MERTPGLICRFDRHPAKLLLTFDNGIATDSSTPTTPTRRRSGPPHEPLRECRDAERGERPGEHHDRSDEPLEVSAMFSAIANTADAGTGEHSGAGMSASYGGTPPAISISAPAVPSSCPMRVTSAGRWSVSRTEGPKANRLSANRCAGDHADEIGPRPRAALEVRRALVDAEDDEPVLRHRENQHTGGRRDNPRRQHPPIAPHDKDQACGQDANQGQVVSEAEPEGRHRQQHADRPAAGVPCEQQRHGERRHHRRQAVYLRGPRRSTRSSRRWPGRMPRRTPPNGRPRAGAQSRRPARMPLPL